jgi:hypothetical protein
MCVRLDRRLPYLGDERATSPLQLAEMSQLQRKMRGAGIVSAILLAVAVLEMRIARYLPW